MSSFAVLQMINTTSSMLVNLVKRVCVLLIMKDVVAGSKNAKGLYLCICGICLLLRVMTLLLDAS